MRDQFANQTPAKKTIRRLFAAEGFLELQLPERAIQELNGIDDAGELSPYVNFLRGQAYRGLGQYDNAIDALQLAARTIPAPLDRLAWGDLSDCFRHEGLEELADIADMFAADPLGGADRDFSDADFSELMLEFSAESPQHSDLNDSWERSPLFQADDFENFNFDEDWEIPGSDLEEDFPSSHRKPPRK